MGVQPVLFNHTLVFVLNILYFDIKDMLITVKENTKKMNNEREFSQ